MEASTLKTWTETKPNPERDRQRREMVRARRVCAGLTRCLIRKDWVRYKRWQKLHAEFYGY